MRTPMLFIVAGLAFVLLATPSVVLADDRVALVVGNSTYAHVARLPNPENDATDMSAALRGLGFEVTTELDADRAELAEALRAFTRQSVGADVSLVFYAGHGMEVDGVNYLVPVDARLERDTDVRFETMTLEDVLAATTGASLRVVILDACRNNPLAQSLQRTVTSRSVSKGSFGDLDDSLLGEETLVAYAAAAGTTAADGEERNSPYTSALLAHLEQPLELLTLFRRVREQVLVSTKGLQRPHEYHSLVKEYYLSEASGGVPVATAATGAGAISALRLQQETLFWQSIAESDVAADFQAYLELFPRGTFVRLARNRLAALSAVASDPPAVERSRPVPNNPPVVEQQETLFWQSIAESDVAADFQAYLELFPRSTFARLAQNRLAALSAVADDPPAMERPRPVPSDPPAVERPRPADPPDPSPPRPRVAEIQEHVVHVSVVDGQGNPVTGLSEDDLIVQSDGENLETTKFDAVGRPVRLTVFVDNANRGARQVPRIYEGLQAMLRELPAEMEVALVTLARRPRWITRHTSDRAELERGISLISPDPSGSSRFIDALVEEVDRIDDDLTYYPVFIMISADGDDRQQEPTSTSGPDGRTNDLQLGGGPHPDVHGRHPELNIPEVLVRQ